MPRPSRKPDANLADPSQIIADLQRELAQCRAERDEALAQQTATAEVLGVINSSPGDLAPVFDAMLEKATALCDAAFGNLWTYDGECFRAVALRRVPAGFAEFLAQGPYRPEPGSAHERLMGGEPFVQIEDVAAKESIGPTRRALVELGGARSIIAVPLRKDNAVLGVITAYRQEVRPFTDKQIALLQNFAAQAVIAMENARLITETREALEQQTATAEVLQVINSSPGDLAPVFDAILEKARKLCGFAHGTLNTYDGEYFRTVAFHAIPEAFADVLRQPRRTGPNFERLLRGEGFVQVADLTDRKFSSDDPVHRAAVEIGGVRTLLMVPLRKDGVLLGYFTANRQEVRPFTDKQIALLQNFAAQAVIAMENARLITETREALEQQTATAEVLGVINSSPGDLAPVFDAMLEKAMRLCATAFGGFYAYDGEFFRATAFRGMPPALVEFFREPFRAGRGSATGRLADGEPIVHIADITALEPSPGIRAIAELGGGRTAITVALRKEETLLGFISMYRQEVRPFTDKQIALLQNFAAQAVIAMENARLITETREALEQQTATAEVLQVINSSPGDLAPVFDAILEKAHALCDSGHGSLFLRDGERFLAAAMRGVPEPLAERLRQGQIGLDAPVTRPLLAGEPFVHLVDLAAIDHPLARAAHAGGIRTTLSVPLRKGDELIGLIVGGRFETQPFTDKQIALLQNFAAQAVIAMENARLITETREALEQQTATAEVLQIINSSPGDLAPVFDVMLEKAMRLCEANFGQFATYDGEQFRTAAVRGVPEAYADFTKRNPSQYGGSSIPHRLLAGERMVHTADLMEDDLYRNGDPNRRAVVDLAGARSALVVPLLSDEAVRGFISVFRQEVYPFTDRHIALLRNFAAQAVIAMENARLLGELRARTEEIAGWNRELEARVAAQLGEIERTGKLRRFLAPQLADLIVAQGDESILESHRREIVVVFCDLRGFTGFAERAEPEEVMALLADYHAAMGPIVARFEGTLDHYAGDGIMVFFNDPVPTPDPARRAIEMAVAMRAAAQDLLRSWRRHGHDIGFGVGISQGYATLGQIGFAERMDYTAIGTVTNLAARLCAEAKDGQILVSRRVAIAVEDSARLEEIGDLALKGLSQAVAVYNVPLSPIGETPEL